MALFRKSKQSEDKKAKTGKEAGEVVDAGKKSDAKKEPAGKQSTKSLYQDGRPQAKKEKKRKAGSAYRVLVKPLITEKASIGGTLNKYFFEVDRRANKIEIAKAIEEVYGVRPVSVNTVNVKGKKVRYGRTLGKRKDWKKAAVTLPKGKSINIYEGV